MTESNELFFLSLNTTSPYSLIVVHENSRQNILIEDDDSKWVCCLISISCLVQLHYYFTQQISQCFIDLNELQVREGSFITTVPICILMTSGGPLQEDIYFTVGAKNGSAIG